MTKQPFGHFSIRLFVESKYLFVREVGVCNSHCIHLLPNICKYIYPRYLLEKEIVILIVNCKSFIEIVYILLIEANRTRDNLFMQKINVTAIAFIFKELFIFVKVFLF